MSPDDLIYKLQYNDHVGTKKRSEVTLTKKEIQRLEPAVYLNDELVLFYLKFMQCYTLPQSL